MVNAVEFKTVIPFADALVHFRCAQEQVLVQRQHFVEFHCVLRRVKVRQIAQDISKGVADLTVVFRYLLHQIFRYGYIFLKVYGRHPEPDDLATEAVGDVHGIDSIARRL